MFILGDIQERDARGTRDAIAMRNCVIVIYED